MQNIEINISNKIATLKEKFVGVCGNSDYVVVFDFDDEWELHSTKTARFKHGGQYTDVVFTGNECPMPVILDTASVEIGVYAGNLHTTTSACVLMKTCVLSGSGVPSDPIPDVYNQIIDKINDGMLKGEDGVSPSVEVSKSGDTTTIAITDASGVHTAGIKDGSKGDKGDKGDPGAPGKDGSDANVTAENIQAALGYAPVKDVQVAGTSVMTDGVANVPIANKGGLGVSSVDDYSIGTTDAGVLFLYNSRNGNIDARSANIAVTPYNLDYAVKAAMCDGKGAAWTSAEQAAARDRMGIDKPYELIETVVVTEDISRFERTAEPNGTPYSFTAMRIHFGANFNGVPDVKSGIYALTYFGDTSHPEYIYQYLPVSPVYAGGVMVNSVAWAELTHGYWLSLVKQNDEGGPTGNGSWLSTVAITNPSARLVLSGATLPRISKVTVVPYTGDKVIQAGVTIKIYGVRA